MEKQNILIVDDRPENLMALEAILDFPDLNIVKATSGKDALWLIVQNDFALVILDVQMPDMNGFEVAELIRGKKSTKGIPIVFITAINKEEKHVFKGYESGAVDYLFKPIEETVLQSKVRIFLELDKQKNIIKKQAEELRDSEQKFRSITDSAQDAIILIDNNETISYWNKSAERIFDYSGDMFVDKKLSSFLLANECQKDFQDGFASFKEIDKGCFFDRVVELIAVKSDGTEFPIEVSLAGLKVKAEWGAVAIIRDITSRKMAEDQLRSLAHFDQLSELPNRTLFIDRLEHALALAKRNSLKLGLIYMDLDRFKAVNDTHGHDIGDLLLKEAAKRLLACVRESDTVARMGGDEFTIILTAINDEHDVSHIAEKIIKTINAPFFLAGCECSVGASIGISLFPADGNKPEEMLKNADSAMYSAKKEGKNDFRFYTFSMNARSLDRLTMENNLHKAIERQEFMLYYQPQVDVNTFKVTGMEALIRWSNEELGVVSPAKFIPIAEETGFISLIDEWVIRTACDQNVTWHKNGFPMYRMAVNLSASRFSQKRHIDVIKNVLNETGLPAEYFELELTERLLMENSEIAITALQEFQEAGIHISIDDFGTGYSSMSYLQHLPLNKLKIDISFVRNITTSADSVSIVNAIINLAHSLKLKVIAEGVETKEQLDILHRLKCNEMQGFLFSKPLPSSEFRELVTKDQLCVKN